MCDSWHSSNRFNTLSVSVVLESNTYIYLCVDTLYRSTASQLIYLKKIRLLLKSKDLKMSNLEKSILVTKVIK